MSESDKSNRQPEKQYKRAGTRSGGSGHESGSDSGREKIRRKRKRVKDSRDPKLREEGKKDKDTFDPNTAVEREENTWVKKKSSKKLSRKQIVIRTLIGFFAVAALIGGLAYRQKQKKKREQTITEKIFREEELAVKRKKVLTDNEAKTQELTESEQISMELPELREITIGLLEQLRDAESVEDLKKITRNYPNREADLARWISSTSELRRPRAEDVFMNPIVTEGIACVQLIGELKDYSYFVSYLLKDQDTWVLDWESFIAKSEISLAELHKNGSKREIAIRGMVEPGDFYTPPIVNDSDYSCYLVRTLNELEYIWVYTPRGGSMDRKLQRQITSEFQGLDAGNNTAPEGKGTMRAFRLRIKPMFGAILKSQFELVTIEGQGWLDPHKDDTDE